MSHPRLLTPRRLFADVYVATDRPIGASLIAYERKRVDARPALKAENCNVPVVVIDAEQYERLMLLCEEARHELARVCSPLHSTVVGLEAFIHNQPKAL